MDILRTPDGRFENLPGWSFPPHYATITDAATGQDLRMAYVDEGPRGGPVVLLLHGEPSWSYLYRHIIPPLAASGHRVVAPDLVGFGRSDKPADRDDYTYERHVAWLSQWFTAMDLHEVTLFCQDWGGLLGLRLVAAFPERFAGVVVANTGLPVGTPASEGFRQWLQFSQSTLIPIGCLRQHDKPQREIERVAEKPLTLPRDCHREPSGFRSHHPSPEYRVARPALHGHRHRDDPITKPPLRNAFCAFEAG